MHQPKKRNKNQPSNLFMASLSLQTCEKTSRSDSRQVLTYTVGMHNIGFLQISDTLIFLTNFSATDIFPFVWKQHQVSPVQKL